jgi:cation:H+ antiporter
MDAFLQAEQWLPLWLRFTMGFVLLLGGAEALVRGASRLAAGVGVPPLVVGLTVVAFGTSAPELAVSVGGTLTGNSGVAVGNIVGSNIMNVLLVLGGSALIAPMIVKSQLVRLDVPLMIIASVAVWLMALNGTISRFEGMTLFGALIVYLVVVYQSVRRGKKAAAVDVEIEGADEALTPKVVLVNLGLLLAGLLGLTLGARWLVEGAVEGAKWLGVSELVIGLTVVAIGTSLPEMATSILAALRGERDLAVGNVVGSNLFNLLCVLGLTASVSPLGLGVERAAVTFDLPVMVAVAFVCLPIFVTGGRVSRGEGLLLIGYFVAYITFVLLKAAEHEALETFNAAMLLFVVPLTTLGLIGTTIITIRHRRNRHRRLKHLLAQRSVA